MSRGGKTWSFVLVAAGNGTRMGGEPKQFRRLGQFPMWKWSARMADELHAQGMIDELVVVFPAGYESMWKENAFSVPTSYTVGGHTRTESVRNGLAVSRSEFAMIHDAARPFLPAWICERLMETVTEEIGAIPLLESHDSLKMVDDVISVIPREKIFRTQTPQAFKKNAIMDVIDSGPCGAADEAALWIRAGKKLASVPGSPANFKITSDFDWLTAGSIAESGRISRVGMGYDVHELVPGRKLVLGGLAIDAELGLLGHSDADIVCHAIADALLGAAGEGDIGTMFPASEERHKGADSMELLKTVVGLIAGKGWSVENVDAVLTAQIPRLGDKTARIVSNLTQLMRTFCPYAEVSVKVKSGEGIGSVGRAECMQCYAVALIEKFVFPKEPHCSRLAGNEEERR
ncbi:MAG: 2-C-methyl-D-erythritol 2,4-cyclodiphosphate synthase [Synergistaceae bacterium]|jgi:2-C-methyl-D-erythritol 4-phosphate cytidylyltransferase/2-C-methyl-D-erythritol 2,4-cyclodiphosphate synthase|nr:2-C-methyl-D-erythritol 2,4-cyclodiphosphate synthase [Synergistaceae bacterium]